MRRSIFKSDIILFFLLLFVFSGALMTAYIRVSATMTGYAIGELKDKEFELLEEKSRLRMKIAKLTRKENLILLASRIKKSNKEQKELASQ